MKKRFFAFGVAAILSVIVPSTMGHAQTVKSVSTKQTTEASTDTVKETETEKVQTVIDAGKKYIGHSVYVFGGGRNTKDIAKGRFDCSGFVAWAFQQADIDVPASTAGLIDVGTPIAINDIKPGDLVFFDTYKKNGHVGIYIGDGKYIGSQSSTGVAIADMNSGYWKENFSGRINRVF